MHVEVDARAARARRRDRPAAGRARRATGATARTCTRTAPAGSGPPSSPAPASSRTSWPSRLAAGVSQYVILGAGLDTLAQRRPELGDRLRIFEVDQPGTQAWKRRRLDELGYGVPDWLRLVPVDFETGESWWDGLGARPASTPVGPRSWPPPASAMYLTKEATAATLRQLAALAPGSTRGHDASCCRSSSSTRPTAPASRPAPAARSASGTPFISFYTPDEMRRRWPATPASATPGTSRPASLADRYFAGRADGLRPSTGEDLLRGHDLTGSDAHGPVDGAGERTARDAPTARTRNGAARP